MKMNCKNKKETHFGPPGPSFKCVKYVCFLHFWGGINSSKCVRCKPGRMTLRHQGTKGVSLMRSGGSSPIFFLWGGGNCSSRATKPTYPPKKLLRFGPLFFRKGLFFFLFIYITFSHVFLSCLGGGGKTGHFGLALIAPPPGSASANAYRHLFISPLRYRHHHASLSVSRAIFVSYYVQLFCPWDLSKR